MGAPSILFIDEVDCVVGKRAEGQASKGVQERVLSTLLNEMDGIGHTADTAVRGPAYYNMELRFLYSSERL
jgi:SpoVK/Ycf46/Vps4 family AAA+-type ATPase